MAIKLSADFEVAPVNTGWQVYEYPSGRPDAMSVSADFARTGTKSCKVTLFDTDPPAQFGNTRTEFTNNNSGANSDSSHRWWAVSWYFPSAGFPFDSKECVIMQWHDKSSSCSASPFVAIEAKSGRLRAMVRYNTTQPSYCNNSGAWVLQIFDLGPIPYNQWLDVVVYIDFQIAVDGAVKIWFNDVLKLNYVGKNYCYGSWYPFFKIGVYKWGWDGSTTTDASSLLYYQDRIRIADSGSIYSDVAIPSSTGSNNPPSVNAGSPQVIPAASTTCTLSGSASDSDGTISTKIWSFVSGPSTPTILNSTSFVANVSGLVPGTYTFNLAVTDNNGAAANATTTVRVNRLPVINLSGNTTSYPAGTTTAILSSSVSDPDGVVTGYAWSKISGPTGSIITNPTSRNTTITGLTYGTYNYSLSATDNDGEAASNDIFFTVGTATTIKTNKRFRQG